MKQAVILPDKKLGRGYQQSRQTPAYLARWPAVCMLVWLGMIGCQSSRPIHLAVAANLIGPASEICAAFEQKTGQTVSLISGASGLLSTQIHQGAPFDLFISANPAYAKDLYASGHCKTPPQPLVYGALAGWSASPSEGKWAERLAQKPASEKLCIAHPDLAPYGTAARAWLQQQGCWDSTGSSLVLGESVGQVNQFIRSQSVEWAITAASAQYSPALADVGYWTPLTYAGDSILAQTLVSLIQAQPAASALATFLQSDTAQIIFQRYGYRPVASAP